MSFFCFLWIPLFEFLWLSLSPGKRRGAGGVWALFLGTLSALIRYFNGPFIKNGGFGFYRWISAFVDYFGFPVGLPFLAFAFLYLIKVTLVSEDLTHFTLLWLIPEGVLGSLSWSVLNDPLRLILLPLLWTSIALTVPAYLQIALTGMSKVRALAIIAIPIQFFLAVTVYWAFFIQNQKLAYSLLIPTTVPALIILILAFHRVSVAGKSENQSLPRRRL